MIASSISQKTNSTRASMAVRGISLSWGMHILKETQTAFTRGSRRSWCRLCIPPSLLKLPAHSWSLTIETTRNFSWSSQENSDVPFLYIFWSGISQEKKKKHLCSDRMSMGKKSHLPLPGPRETRAAVRTVWVSACSPLSYVEMPFFRSQQSAI